jgi:hypothetical protein
MTDSTVKALDLAAELVRAPPHQLVLRADQMLQIIGMLQLALRHPDFEDDDCEHQMTVKFVREFIETVRDDGFKGFPAVQRLIDEGDDSEITLPC